MSAIANPDTATRRQAARAAKRIVQTGAARRSGIGYWMERVVTEAGESARRFRR